ncbi:unnamed protein product [Didymodactylos carnosus]|uniref:Non-specific serine/threonine protein kinase n=2 Tax=Didymodactylos carnosus TaxID=1234261 RepID=A0A8S2DUP0_9BILA|nr:unnamed protein product [Didymodactylos carnosus]CAF3825059.1 unnamed protein product [Didymodactylos carnosus]
MLRMIFEEYASRYDQNRLMPLTLLVCDPGTYAYYKRQRKTISSGLSTVIFMPPVLVSNSVDAHRTSCDGCGAVRFTTDRYKCLQCTNYDLCARCFERRRETKNHLSGHPVVQFRTPNEVLGRELRNNDLTLTNLKVLFQLEKHENISCDGCLLDPIVGLRFKCDTCPNYDLCHQCMTNSVTTNSHKSDHPLVVVPKHRIPVIPRDDIELGDALGKGAFGTVYKATWLSKNRVVACKVITAPANLSEGLFKSFLKELAAYTELSGAYILKTYGYTQTELADGVNEYRLIMEFMEKGSLQSLIEKPDYGISLRRKLDMACNIASGMRKIHEHNMIHRDIRPDNILVNNNFIAKIGDMGIARTVDENNRHTQIGCQSQIRRSFLPKYDGDSTTTPGDDDGDTTTSPSYDEYDTDTPSTDSDYDPTDSVTDAPVTDDLVTDAPVTDPVETDAPVTDPVETDAPVTDPVETDAPVTDPVETDAPVTDPIETDAPPDYPVTDSPDTDAPSYPDTDAPSYPDTEAPPDYPSGTDAPSYPDPEPPSYGGDDGSDTGGDYGGGEDYGGGDYGGSDYGLRRRRKRSVAIVSPKRERRSDSASVLAVNVHKRSVFLATVTSATASPATTVARRRSLFTVTSTSTYHRRRKSTAAAVRKRRFAS